MVPDLLNLLTILWLLGYSDLFSQILVDFGFPGFYTLLGLLGVPGLMPVANLQHSTISCQESTPSLLVLQKFWGEPLKVDSVSVNILQRFPTSIIQEVLCRISESPFRSFGQGKQTYIRWWTKWPLYIFLSEVTARQWVMFSPQKSRCSGALFPYKQDHHSKQQEVDKHH